MKMPPVANEEGGTKEDSREERVNGEAGFSLRLLEERAKRLGRDGEWGALALGINSRILDADPDNLGALTRRARCNVALDEYAAAKADFERALALGPRSRMQREDLERGLAKVERGFEEAEGRAKRRREAAGRRAAEAERARARARRRVETRTRLLAEIGEITGFEEARALGALYAGGYRGGGAPGRTHAVGVDLELAETALRRAWELDPRRRDPAGATPASTKYRRAWPGSSGRKGTSRGPRRPTSGSSGARTRHTQGSGSRP